MDNFAADGGRDALREWWGVGMGTRVQVFRGPRRNLTSGGTALKRVHPFRFHFMNPPFLFTIRGQRNDNEKRRFGFDFVEPISMKRK